VNSFINTAIRTIEKKKKKRGGKQEGRVAVFKLGYQRRGERGKGMWPVTYTLGLRREKKKRSGYYVFHLMPPGGKKEGKEMARNLDCALWWVPARREGEGGEEEVVGSIALKRLRKKEKKEEREEGESRVHPYIYRCRGRGEKRDEDRPVGVGGGEGGEGEERVLSHPDFARTNDVQKKKKKKGGKRENRAPRTEKGKKKEKKGGKCFGSIATSRYPCSRRRGGKRRGK